MIKIFDISMCPICKKSVDEPFIHELIRSQDHKLCFYNGTASEVKALLDQHKTQEALQLLFPVPELKNDTESCFDRKIEYHMLFRNGWINNYFSWHLPPTYEQLLQICDFIDGDTVLEVGAGKGLLAALLRSMNINITATDPKAMKQFFPSGGIYDPVPDLGLGFTYCEMEQLTCKEAIQKHKVEVLIEAWGRGFITEEDYQNFQGNKLIIIGEQDGCTSCGYLQTAIDNGEWELTETLDIPVFFGIRDYCFLYRRNNTAL